MIKRILLVLAALVILAQFIRPPRVEPNSSDPSNDLITITGPPAAVEGILRSACYDCHSDQPRYPWYSNITPVNFWLQDHIDEAREELNFSQWGTYSAKRITRKIKEIDEEVSEGEMPLLSYTWLHAQARLTDVQRQELVAFFQALPH
jgi:hypothetical protein